MRVDAGASLSFVHYMEHSDLKEALAVGCICAEHMEQDYVGPRELSHVSQSCDGIAQIIDVYTAPSALLEIRLRPLAPADVSVLGHCRSFTPPTPSLFRRG